MRQKMNHDGGAPLSTNVPRFARKGLGSWHKLTTPLDLKNANLGWYYNWRPFEKIGPVSDVEFVPMFWCASDVTPENLATVQKSEATHVLGFNEPDMPGQANMTPEECMEHWPKLMTLKQRLGSPAPADSTWIDKFLPEAIRRGLRIDFICLHRYPDVSNPGSVKEIEKMLTDAHQKYGLPVWLTECGAADIAAWHQPRLAKPTAAMARIFLKNLLAMLDGLPFVERYAWFADRVTDEYRIGTIFHPRASRLTPLGRIYRDWV